MLTATRALPNADLFIALLAPDNCSTTLKNGATSSLLSPVAPSTSLYRSYSLRASRVPSRLLHLARMNRTPASRGDRPSCESSRAWVRMTVAAGRHSSVGLTCVRSHSTALWSQWICAWRTARVEEVEEGAVQAELEVGEAAR